MGGFGWPEILIIMVIVVLIFGVGKVADVGPALGKAISGFRKAVKEGEDEADKEAEKEAPESETTKD
jgi:sec-independent protein translocase protein TatA